jgi:hypothetical protein
MNVSTYRPHSKLMTWHRNQPSLCMRVSEGSRTVCCTRKCFLCKTEKNNRLVPWTVHLFQGGFFFEPQMEAKLIWLTSIWSFWDKRYTYIWFVTFEFAIVLVIGFHNIYFRRRGRQYEPRQCSCLRCKSYVDATDSTTYEHHRGETTAVEVSW